MTFSHQWETLWSNSTLKHLHFSLTVVISSLSQFLPKWLQYLLFERFRHIPETASSDQIYLSSVSQDKTVIHICTLHILGHNYHNYKSQEMQTFSNISEAFNHNKSTTVLREAAPLPGFAVRLCCRQSRAKSRRWCPAAGTFLKVHYLPKLRKSSHFMKETLPICP